MNDQKVQKVELPIALVNAIMGFLVKQPFEQVANLIGAIQQETQGNQNRSVPPPAH